MSVAFRREGDDEHLEPKFELPIPPGANLVTPRGLALIEARVSELEQRLAEPLGEDERKAVLRDARYWRSRHASAQIVPPASGERVAVGTLVTFRRGDTEQTIGIVGHDEADPATGLIGFTAPLVRAMLGAEVDDVVEQAGTTLEILRIEPLAP